MGLLEANFSFWAAGSSFLEADSSLWKAGSGLWEAGSGLWEADSGFWYAGFGLLMVGSSLLKASSGSGSFTGLEWIVYKSSTSDLDSEIFVCCNNAISQVILWLQNSSST